MNDLELVKAVRDNFIDPKTVPWTFTSPNALLHKLADRIEALHAICDERDAIINARTTRALPAVQLDAAAIREAALREALDAAFPIVRKASVAAKMDAVNASPSDPTALQREAWMRKCDAALELVVSARALIDTGEETK